MYQTSISVLIFAVVVPAQAAPVPSQLMAPEPYYSMQVGATAVHRLYNRGVKLWDSTCVISATVDSDQGTVVTDHLVTTLRGIIEHPGREDRPIHSVSDDPYSKVLVAPDGVFMLAKYDIPGKKWVECDPPACLLKLPAIPGTEWTTKCGTMVSTYRIGEVERVTVLAGTFDAVRVDVERAENGKPYPSGTIWFARGIGIIKSADKDETVLELVSFTRGK